MTDLGTLVEALKRELAIPGIFEDVFPDTDDTALTEALKDGFAEAQLYGYFTTLTLTGDETSEDLSLAGGALIILFTAMRTLRAQLRSLTMNERYKAGPVEYETSRSTNLLRDELKYMKERLDDLLANARRATSAVYVHDGYFARVAAYASSGAFFGYEWQG